MKNIALCGLGNALVDLFVDIEEARFQKLGYERSTMRLVGAEEQAALLKELHAAAPRKASGGSVANSIIAFSQLGGKAAFLSSVGNDEMGKFYREEFATLGIDFASLALSQAPTGTCVALITPDAERTMRTCLGATAELNHKHLVEGTIANSQWLFIEGYVLSNPELGQSAVREAVRMAKAHNTQIAFTCSEAWVVEGFRSAVDQVIAASSLVFANETEARALTGNSSSGEAAFKILCKTVPNVVVTMGAHGALVKWNGVEARISAVPCTPRDLTGAGDMLAGAFLAGVLQGKSVADAGNRAAQLASRVISQVGARLQAINN